MQEILWLTVDQNPKIKKEPKYKRTFGAIDGKVAFVPAWVAGRDGSSLVFCAGFDGAKIAELGGYAYFEAAWVLREFPDSAVAIRYAQESLDEYIDRSTK